MMLSLATSRNVAAILGAGLAAAAFASAEVPAVGACAPPVALLRVSVDTAELQEARK
jgi:hypothetical protein